MKNQRGAWFSKPFGKRLKLLHTSNAWLFLVLSATGAILYWPPLRPILLSVRLWIKNLHISTGFLSVLIFILYIALFKKHFWLIRKKNNQKYNLLLVIALLAGLIVSGIVLTFKRAFSPYLTERFLFIHDALTIFSVPYIIFHSISRTTWLKNPANEKKRENDFIPGPFAIQKQNPVFKRRTFIKKTIGTVLVIAVVPFLLNWISRFFSNGSMSTYEPKAVNDNNMLPAPVPSPQSLDPIGGGAKGVFRPYTVTEVPTYTRENWSFKIDGLVLNPHTYNWGQFVQIPRKVQVSDFHCITGWSVFNVTYEGVLIKDLLSAAGIQNSAIQVKFYSGDGKYTDSLTMEQALMDDVMAAVLQDGKPISKDFGGPVRLIVPKMYAYKGVKWLRRIELIDHKHTGFWEKRGYSKNAWVRKED